MRPYDPQLGDIIRGLSHRGEGIKHGVTVVIEGRITEQVSETEWYVKYIFPITIDDEFMGGGYFKANEMTHMPWREK